MSEQGTPAKNFVKHPWQKYPSDQKQYQLRTSD